MKVLHINSLSSGGAARACQRLNQGLKQSGVDSEVLSLEGFLNLGISIETDVKRRLLWRWQNFLLSGRNPNLEMFSFEKTAYNIKNSQQYKDADIINLHWTSLLLDWKSFFKNNNKKIVWTLHDMNPFTGGCHYSSGCLGYSKRCDNCPQLKGTIFPSISSLVLEQKLKSVGNNKIAVVSPSKWLGSLAGQSRMFDSSEISVIPNSVDKDIYKQHDQNKIRDKFGLPKNKTIIMFVADSINNRRKGYNLLLESLKKIKSNNIQLMAIGNNSQTKKANRSTIYLGPIEDDSVMAELYSAADLFVAPSVEDNLPNTVMEAVMCGTPVVGFEVGGIPDMINRDNGWLTNDLSVNGLADILKRAIREYRRVDRKKVRDEAVKKYQLSVQAKRYIKLYRSL